MARKTESSAAETLDELESLGDRLAEWIGQNPILVLGTALGVLILAAGWGLASSLRDSAADEASAALAEVSEEYRRAMGTPAGSFEIVEPANPETARQARTAALAGYETLVQEYAGEPVGAIAALEAGNLQAELGEGARALETWRAAAEASAADSLPRALLLNRLGAALEAEARWLEAAEAYESASEIAGYPLRYGALLAASRCLAEAGESGRAIALYDRLEIEAPDQRIPDHVRFRMLELKAEGFESRAASDG